MSKARDVALEILRGTRADHSPSTGLNISMDYNASPRGGARGTEVIIPDDASPEVRQAATRFNQMVAEYAAANGIADYPVRGVRTRSENGRGVSNTIHVEPFFNDDLEMQELIKKNPAAFAQIYRDAFANVPGRLIAPHGVGQDRGAASTVFGDETSFGELMTESLLSGNVPAYDPSTVPPMEDSSNTGVPRVAAAGVENTPRPDPAQIAASTSTPEIPPNVPADPQVAEADAGLLGNITGNEDIDGILNGLADDGVELGKSALLGLLGLGNNAPPPMQAPPIPAPPPMMRMPQMVQQPVTFRIKRNERES